MIEQTDDLRPYMLRLVAAVRDQSATAVALVMSEVREEFRVDPGWALAVALADDFGRQRETVARLNGQLTALSEGYLDEKRRVAELREILDQRAADVAVKSKRKAA